MKAVEVSEGVELQEFLILVEKFLNSRQVSLQQPTSQLHLDDCALCFCLLVLVIQALTERRVQLDHMYWWLLVFRKEECLILIVRKIFNDHTFAHTNFG